MRPGLFALTVAAVMAAAGAATVQTQSCEGCVRARFWEVSPTFWTDGSGGRAPEQDKLERARLVDLGVAFSGGGTRSASATIGQLRGLEANGWLSRVRYMTAVSGGSWAAVPYAYHAGSLADLLGPRNIDPATVESVPAGLLAERVVKSGLAHVGLQEAPSFLPGSIAGMDITTLRQYLQTARRGLRKIRKSDVPEPERQNKTYAHMLGQIFLSGLVPDGNRRPYAWDTDMAIDMGDVAGLPTRDIITMPLDRPFLIVGGTAVKRVGAEYPRLIPVEYTPLYTGIRQRFGSIGGTYVWPWAYDRLMVAPRSDSEILVGPEPLQRPFTLADVIASSGAAPQLELLLGTSVPERVREPLRRASEAFPSFSNLAVRAGVPTAPSAEIAHGDGGFTDNLGVMPLLVRQVHNVIVFINSSSAYDRNEQLQSYFMPLRLRDGSGDKSMNAVFERARFKDVLDGFAASTRAGGGALYCGKNWSVKANEIYNIQAYEGLNVCWVYNYAGEQWKQALPSPVKAWVSPPDPEHLTKQAKDLVRFPYYRTFGENRSGVIKLKALQVNLLADLASWSITNRTAAAALVDAFGPGVLPPPAVAR